MRTLTIFMIGFGLIFGTLACKDDQKDKKDKKDKVEQKVDKKAEKKSEKTDKKVEEKTEKESDKKDKSEEKDNVVIKNLPEMTVASLEFIAHPKETAKYIEKLAKTVFSNNVNIAGPIIGIYYDNPEEKKDKCKNEVAIQVTDKVGKKYDDVVIKKLKPETVVSLMVKGPYESAPMEKFPVIIKWMDDNGYETDYKKIPWVREVYFDDPQKVKPENCRTEIQFPAIKK